MPTSTTADGITLSTLTKQYLDPVFTAAGAKKKGRRYEFVNDLGDVSWFDLYSLGWGNGSVGFDASVSISPATAVEWWTWHQHEAGHVDYRPSPLNAPLWGTGVRVPESVQELGHWAFRDEVSARACAAALMDAVTTWVLPVMRLGQDRRALLTAFEQRTIPDPHRMRGTLERTQFLLLVDDGPSPELDAALAAVEHHRDNAEFLRWARLRLNRAPTTVAGPPSAGAR